MGVKMTKHEFLMELRKYLSVLHENEKKDILDEYEQHIDMKMQEGLHEEEVIKEFGPVKDFAADILEAYHVNLDFKVRPEMNFSKVKEESKKVYRGIGGFIKGFWGGLVDITKKICVGIKHYFFISIGFLFRPIRWISQKQKEWKNMSKIQPINESEILQEKKCEVQKVKDVIDSDKLLSRIGRNVKRLMNTIWKNFCKCIIFCIRALGFGIVLGTRILWNGIVGLLIILCGLGTLVCLFLLGILIVLLFQGYPIAGFTISSLGLVLSFGAATSFGTKFFLKIPKYRKEDQINA